MRLTELGKTIQTQNKTQEKQQFFHKQAKGFKCKEFYLLSVKCPLIMRSEIEIVNQ